MVKNNEKKRLFNVLIALVSIVLLIVISVIIDSSSSNEKKVTVNNEIVEDIFARKGLSLVYIGRETCSWSQKFEPNINYLKKTYSFDYDYIDTDLYDEEKLTGILNKLNIDINNFGTPTIVIVENGKVLDSQVGYIDEKPLFDYLKENKIINTDATYIANPKPNDITGNNEKVYENINYINYKEFENLNNGEEPFVLVIGQTGCSYCTKFKPIIDQVSKDNSVTINYIDIKLLSEEEFDNLISNIDYFNTNASWGTPLTLIINKKQTVANLNGYVEASSLKDFLKKNKFLK
ncbi:MAG: thioredoxin family protein [Bacilli bacterium]|nr:thioredoxin family protein [Bacilli bacterium]